MNIIIKLPTPPERNPLRAVVASEGQGVVFKVDFTERARLEREIDRMELEWHDFEMSPGQTQAFVTGAGTLLILAGTETGAPQILARFDAQKLATYSQQRIAQYKRLVFALSQAECHHPPSRLETKRRRTVCGACRKVWMKEPKYRLCRTRSKVAGERCHRREKHKAPCSWDPEWHWRNEH